MTIPRFMVVTLWILGPLTFAAHGGNINGEATYISFSVPGALGTYPMGINASMTVTGYYNVSPTAARGFVREADGAITTFDVLDGVWTEPESINDAGEITGFYEVVAGVPQSFIRYADGQIVTFNPPCIAVGPCNLSAPVSINASGEIVGNYPFLAAGASAGFTRSRAGVITGPIRSDLGAAYGTVATDINASGIVVGYSDNSSGEEVGFGGPISVPVAADQEDCLLDTIPESINAEGTIAGWYLTWTNSCGTKITGGFVLSPDGVTTLFNPPGKLVTFPVSDSFLGGSPLLSFPRSISINQEGTITGSHTDTAGAQHGFVRNPYGTITSFDPPRGRQTTATSINDCGVIVGSYYYDWNAKTAEGFLRVPHVEHDQSLP